jgi:hypothetical protein
MQQAAQKSIKQSTPVFSMNAKYHAASNASPEDLLNDSVCFLESVHSTLCSLASELSEALFRPPFICRKDAGTTSTCLIS